MNLYGLLLGMLLSAIQAPPAAPLDVSPAALETLPGSWVGELQTAGGPLAIVFQFEARGGKLSGFAVTPERGSQPLAMARIELSGDALVLEMASGTYKATLEDGRMSGTWTLGGQSLPLEMKRGVYTPPPVVSAPDPRGIAGRWEGSLTAAGMTLRLVVEITRTGDGIYLGRLLSVDQGARMSIDTFRVEGRTVHFEIRSAAASYDGELSEDRSTLSGTWSQGAPLPLTLKKTAAAIPPDPAVSSPSNAVARAANEPAYTMGIPIDIQTSVRPVPFRGNGRTHLVYELHLTNFGPAPLDLTRFEVLGGDAVLAMHEGAALNSLLVPVGRTSAAASPDLRRLASGSRTVLYAWITLDANPAPSSTLRNRLTLASQVVEMPVLVAGDPVPVLGPPLRGGVWVAGNGPDNAAIHRRALIPVSGQARIAQRFAIDWVQLDNQGRMFDGDEKDNAAYVAYGEEVLAVADGVIAGVKDGIPDNVPGPTSRAVPITLETIGGNYVVLDLGNGRYAFYAHLQPGSVRVMAGDKVRRGQVLGLVGNSGNSTQPHLHFHVSDAPTPLGGEGVPFTIDAFGVFNPATTSVDPRKNELPINNAPVLFP